MSLISFPVSQLFTAAYDRIRGYKVRAVTSVLIAGLVTLVAYVATDLISVPLTPSTDALINSQGSMTSSPGLVVILVSLLSAMVTASCIIFPLGAGLRKTALNHLEGKPKSWRTLFSYFDIDAFIIFASQASIYKVGFVLLMILVVDTSFKFQIWPAVTMLINTVLALLSMVWTYAATYQAMASIETHRTRKNSHSLSVSTLIRDGFFQTIANVRTYWFDFARFGLLCGMLCIATALSFFILAIWTLPMYLVADALMYRRIMFNEMPEDTSSSTNEQDDDLSFDDAEPA